MMIIVSYGTMWCSSSWRVFDFLITQDVFLQFCLQTGLKERAIIWSFLQVMDNLKTFKKNIQGFSFSSYNDFGFFCKLLFMYFI